MPSLCNSLLLFSRLFTSGYAKKILNYNQFQASSSDPRFFSDVNVFHEWRREREDDSESLKSFTIDLNFYSDSIYVAVSFSL